MKVVIFAGGVGKRLWPISRQQNPKQFHKIFLNQTSLEHAYLPLEKKYGYKNIFIATGKDYVGFVKKILPQIPNENIIVEPCVRDNGPAVALAMSYLNSKYPNEAVLIRWQNSLIKDDVAFLNAIDEAELLLKQNEAKLVYLAVPSRFPNTSLGHIKVGEKIKDLKKAIALYNFDSFVEKPDIEKAKIYHTSLQYFWNPGTYITTPKFIIENLKLTSPEIYEKILKIENTDSIEEINKTYESMPKISIDYALWEKLKPNGIKVVLAEYKWFYVSTWKDLKDALISKTEDNYLHGLSEVFDSKNVLLINHSKKKLICAVGLKDINIISTNDAIIILSDESASKVKDVVEFLDKKYNGRYTK